MGKFAMSTPSVSEAHVATRTLPIDPHVGRVFPQVSFRTVFPKGGCISSPRCPQLETIWSWLGMGTSGEAGTGGSPNARGVKMGPPPSRGGDLWGT